MRIDAARAHALSLLPSLVSSVRLLAITLSTAVCNLNPFGRLRHSCSVASKIVVRPYVTEFEIALLNVTLMQLAAF